MEDTGTEADRMSAGDLTHTMAEETDGKYTLKIQETGLNYFVNSL